MMDGTNIISSPNGWKWIDIIHDLGMRLCDLAHQDFIVHCKTVNDIFAAKKEGKIAMVFVIELLPLKTRWTALTSCMDWASANWA